MLAIPALLGEQVTGPYEGPYKPPLEVVVVSYSEVLKTIETFLIKPLTAAIEVKSFKAQWAASKNQWNDEM